MIYSTRLFVGESSWQPDRKLQRRLHMLGAEYDKAAHDEYLSILNERSCSSSCHGNKYKKYSLIWQKTPPSAIKPGES